MLQILKLDKLILTYLTSQNPIILSIASVLSLSLTFIIIAVVIKLITDNKTLRAKILASHFILTYLFVLLLKVIISRPRPDLSNLQSFPSAHAAMAFALAYSSKNKPLFYSYAILVSLSRIILGAHYFTDILAGAIIGLIIMNLLKNHIIKIKKFKLRGS